jgi:hypothetical protein
MMAQADSTFLIDTPERLRAISEPLRQRLLHAFAEPATVKDASVQLGEPVTKLYHHVDQLHTAGLIRLVSEARRRAVTERTFHAVARRFAVSRGAFAAGADTIETERATLARAALDTMLETSNNVEGAFRMVRSAARLSPERLQQVEAELFRLIKEFEEPTAPIVDFLLLTTVKADPEG